MARFEEILTGYDGATDILSDKKITDLNDIEIQGNSSMVLKLDPELKAGK
jgi:hypothetical protein